MQLFSITSKLVDINACHAKVKSALQFLLFLAISLGVGSVHAVDYAYDANGNRISSPTHTFVYDDANRLREVRLKGSNSILIEYLYDYEGNLIRKIQEGITTYYVSKNYHYSTGTKGELEDVYIFAGNNRVASIRNGEIKYHHKNHIGSTDTTTNSLGELTEQLDYAPYGKLLGNANPEVDYTFTGKELHKNTGYIDLGARQYDPETRQFLQPDTVAPIQIDRLRAGPQAQPSVYDTIQISPYSYAKNNPTKDIDPDGNAVETATDILLVVYDAGSLTVRAAQMLGSEIAYQYGRATGDQLLQQAAFNQQSEQAAIAQQGLADLAADGAATFVPFVPAGTSRFVRYSDYVSKGGVPKPSVDNSKLQNIVNDLYKGAKTKNPIGTGSTADAIRYEQSTGQRVGGKFHTQKGQQYVRALKKWLRQNANANKSDIQSAKSILDDLSDALRHKN